MVAFSITAGNKDDRKPLDAMSAALQEKIFADKGYLSQSLLERLWQRGLHFLTGIGPNMKNHLMPLLDKVLLRKRCIIETLFGKLKSIMGVEHTRQRSPINALVHILSSLAAYTLAQPKVKMGKVPIPIPGPVPNLPSLSSPYPQLGLIQLSNGPEEARQKLRRIIEAAADIRNFGKDPERHDPVVNHLNSMLYPDGFELIRAQNGRMQLVESGQETVPLTGLGELLASIRFDTAKRDLDRALASSQNDPEDAVTAACSMVEDVCKSILNELGESIPRKKDVQGLYDALKRPLDLSPDRSDIDPVIAEDVRKVLSGLFTVTAGIGSLRTHGGDAHGRERGSARLDARIARLSIHAASTLALFLIETWQRRQTRSTR